MLFRKTKTDRMEKSAILPVEEPLVNVYPHVAAIFSVYGRNRWELPMLFNEMIGILYDEEKERADFNISMEILPYMMNYPMCTMQCIPRKMVVERWKSFTEFLISVIDDGFYAQCLLEAHKIPAYTEIYGGTFFQHDIMIYGYDKGREIFYAADAFERGIYGFKEVAFRDMEHAWSVHPADDWLEGVRLFQPKKHHPQPVWYDLNYMKVQCKCFIKGKFVKCAIASDVRHFPKKQGLFYGIHAYKAAAEYLKELRYENPYKMADVRIFSVFREHAKIMACMSRELMQRGQLEGGDVIWQQFSSLEKLWENIISRVLKYNLSEATDCPEGILEDIEIAGESVLDAMNKMVRGIRLNDQARNEVFSGSFPADSLVLEYTGKWKHSPSALEDKYTTQEGAAVRWQFAGTEVNIYGGKKRLGKVRVSVDGKVLEETTMRNWELENGYPRYHIKTASGYHVLEITNLTSEGCSIHRVDALGMDIGRSSAVFLGGEVSTRGLWKKEYGKAGYEIIGDKRKLPWYVMEAGFVYRGAVYVLMEREGRNLLMLERAGQEQGYVGAYQLAAKEFSLEMAVTGKREVSFYCADYDNMGREFVCLVEDADTGKLLSRQAISLRGGAIWLKYEMEGHVKVRFLRTFGPDVVLSGMFFE